ncbi:hypothetical protein BT69DRAFT_1344573 [Atractiella rhizophila]|nr:hypothetical protein BT69DRAFT_1344573 [Atractiella rhizophila]
MPFHSPLMTHEEYEQSRRLLAPEEHSFFVSIFKASSFLRLTLFVSVTCWIQFVAFFTDLQGAIFLSYTEWWQSAFTLIDASCGLYVKWWVIAIIVAVLIFSYISIIIATILITEAKFNLIARWVAGHYRCDTVTFTNQTRKAQTLESSGVLAGDIHIAACTAYFLLTQTKKAILPQ